MSEYINDSGFLLNSYKYDQEKRTSVVVSFTTTEPTISKYVTIDEIIYHLNNYYMNSINEQCPYHYIITVDGQKHLIKNPELVVSSSGCRLDSYKDDVKVLVMADRVGIMDENQKNTLVDIIAEESEKYALFISDTVFCQITSEKYMNDDGVKSEILKSSILRRNERNSLFCILEHVINDEIIKNDKIVAIPPLTDELTLDDIAIQYNIPRSILTNLNPHIKSDEDLDVVFIPNTEALSYKISANKINKSLLVNAFDIKKIKEDIENVL